MRNRILFSFLAWVAVIVSVQGKQKDFVLQSGRPVAIACSGSEAPVVRTSLDLLSRDPSDCIVGNCPYRHKHRKHPGRNDRTEQAD